MRADDTRLIESTFPIDRIGAIASREKLHPHHYVTLIHYWPARRPTTACRAAIYATLVPNPRTEQARREAESFVAKLASYNVAPSVVEDAKRYIWNHNGGKTKPPKILDMFAGGGAIPLEVARLGCESHAVDYNPVAHLIELCTLAYPQKFGSSLAEDFKTWSGQIFDRVRDEICDLYPTVHISGDKFTSGRNAEPVAYIWARTVPCKRPDCNASVPLVRQSRLSKKHGGITAIPSIKKGQILQWEIMSGSSSKTITIQEKQTGSGQAVCVACGTPVPSTYVKEMSKAGNLSESLAAVVVQGVRSKHYVAPNATTRPDYKACTDRLENLLNETGIAPLTEEMNTKDSTTVAGRGYGICTWQELFTPRQLLVLFTLVKHIRLAHAQMLEAGMDEERARALTTYFAMAFGRFVNCFNKFTRWAPKDQITMGAIGDRQALKMVNDFSEINCLARTQGCISFAFEKEEFCIRELAKITSPSTVSRGNAEKLLYDSETFDAIITDPPYYNSIYYADLSAFFYVWLRRIVGDLYPKHFTLSTPPKRREAVAQPSEHKGSSQVANNHYQDVMQRAFAEAKRVLKRGAPLVCIYAHKTTEGWSTLIRALVGAGFTVTEAWPVQTESPSRANTQGAAALSNSIFFVARKRDESLTGRFEIDVEPELHRIVQERVTSLWDEGNGIGGANLLMAAVGAGLRAYTKFESVEYANGEPMQTESYIQEVERVVLDTILDKIFGLHGSMVAAIDPASRFYILWRFTFHESYVDGGNAYVFCQPQGVEIDGPSGISGSSPSLVEKNGGKFRVRSYEERGNNENLGTRIGDKSAPLIDSLHRLIWLVENRPAEARDFLKTTKPNAEQLRLVAQALSAPSLGRTTSQNKPYGREVELLAKIIANWRNVVEGAVFDKRIRQHVKGQSTLSSFNRGGK